MTVAVDDVPLDINLSVLKYPHLLTRDNPVIWGFTSVVSWQLYCTLSKRPTQLV